DVNGDGRPDLVVTSSYADQTSTISVLLGDGDGSFQAPRVVASNIRSFSVTVTVADVNGDGRPDLVGTSSYGHPTSTTSRLLRDGAGSFQAPEVVASNIPFGPVSVADVNGDGRPDLVVATFSYADQTSTISVLLGDGSFQAPRVVASTIPFAPVSVADVNGD